MDGTCSQQNSAISRIRKRKHKEIYDDLGANKPNSMSDFGIGKLCDDLIIAVLCGLKLKEAARTSVLSRRWKYLWMSAITNLEFDDDGMERKKFISWVNNVVKLYQARPVDSLIIRFSDTQSATFRGMSSSSSTSDAVDSWIRFALHKGVHRLLLETLWDGYDFPNIKKILSYSPLVNSPLRSLQLFRVDIEDEVVHYFLASCPRLEELCISHCYAARNLHVVDPPNLKVLEIKKCPFLQTLEISAVNLVSLTYQANINGLLLKKIPNLREVTLGEGCSDSFIIEPQAHSNYSVQLVKLRLMLYHVSGTFPPNLPKLCSLKRLELLCPFVVSRNVPFFSSFLKAAPQLREVRIEMYYTEPNNERLRRMMYIPSVSTEEAVKFDHKNLELVEMSGYVGSLSEEKLLVHLFEIASSLKRVVIDTQSDYYHDHDFGLKQRVEHLVSNFPRQIEFIVKRKMRISFVDIGSIFL